MLFIMDNNIHETIKDIKSKFRLFMNGMVSQSMREKGMEYKLNFGIEYPRIKEIAAGYEPDHELAQALWKENIRECKILAGLLQPADTFYPEIADIWIEGMDYPELAEYTVMNLFQRLPYASEVVFRWMADDRTYFQLCGFLLMSRLLTKGMILNERTENEFLDQAFAVMEDNNVIIQKAAFTAVYKFAMQSEINRGKVLGLLVPMLKSKKETVSSLAEEMKNRLDL